jgi:hypothetical protein
MPHVPVPPPPGASETVDWANLAEQEEFAEAAGACYLTPAGQGHPATDLQRWLDLCA